MLGQRRFGKIQMALLVVIALVMGATLISPAVGHVKRSLKHLYKHLDPRYINVGETVALATTATNATNADKLDNLDSADFVKKSETFNRNWSCAGTDWDEYEDGDIIAADGGSGRYSTNNALVRCSVTGIPDGATVTATHFAVRDSSAAQSISCDMWRTNTAASVGAETFMATASTTAAATPGNTRITDTTITQPTIDNGNFAYFVQCFLGTTIDIRVFGGNIAYTVTGGQGAGRVAPAPSTAEGISSDA